MREASGIILAGVHRWDDSGFDELLPRPLMPVAHSPLICHILGWLREAGVTHATVCANSASRQMRHTLANGTTLGIDVAYYEDWTPRGPAGCIRDAATQVNAEQFVVADGTILPACDLGALLERHSQSGAAMTIVVARDPDSSNGTQERLMPVGIYVLDRFVLEHIPETGYQDIKEVLLPRLHERGVRVRTHTLPAPCPRIISADSYLAMNAWALERLMRANRTPPGYRRIGQSIVHESVRALSQDGHLAEVAIGPGTMLPPVLIGPGTMLALGATLIGPTMIGAECVIEPGAVICNSVLWNGCRVARGAVVNHCVLADAVEVEAEATLVHAALAAEPDGRGPLPPTVHAESWLFPALPENEHRHGPKNSEVRRAAKPPVQLSTTPE